MPGKLPLLSTRTERAAKEQIARGGIVGAYKTIMKELHAKYDANADHYNKALAAFKKKDYQVAIDEARQSLKGNTRDPDAWYLISESQFQLGLYAECARSCERRLAIDPADVDAAEDIAYCHWFMKKPGLAIDQCNKILARPGYKQDFLALYVKASALGDLRRWRESVALWQILVKIKPKDGMSWYHLGWACHEAGLGAAAIDAMKRHVKLEPKGAEGHCSLGYFYDVAGDDEQAVAGYGRALELDPSDAYAMAALQRIARKYQGRRGGRET